MLLAPQSDARAYVRFLGVARMERADKIFVALAAVALIAILAHDYRSPLRGVRLNVSASPDDRDRGPAYLLSNLPRHRIADDELPSVSYPTGC